LAAYVWGSELLLSRVYRGCPFLVISDSTRQDLISRGIPAGKITVSHCGIDHGTYVPAHGTEPADPPLIVHLGRMKRYKNVDHVLKAMPLIWEREPRARLVLAGAGEYLPRLKEISRRLGLDDRVEFAGYLTLPRIVALLQRATVVLNTSSKEGWGLTVVEANACGCPVVAYDVPGLRDSVADGETGFLVPFRDIPALADRAKALLSDRALRERLGKAAREWAVKFSWDTAADEMLDMIRLAAENSAERS
jgi:glycosyltransferase involved in cell wall biosynthesis